MMRAGTTKRFAIVAAGVLLIAGSARATLPPVSFEPGDLFLSTHTGQVQWRHPDGTLVALLVNTIPGKAEGMTLDASQALYVTHHCADTLCLSGNAVEKFGPDGVSRGRFGSGFDCNPNSILFDGAGRAFVGQMDCTGDLLEFNRTGEFQVAFEVAAENRGTGWIDLGGDGCTMLYTSSGVTVKRFNVCAGVQLADFTAAPLPGEAGALRVLPDGGVLVAASDAIVRLDAGGRAIQTYDAPSQPGLWLGLDLAGDGTFWATNYGSGDVARFDLATGTVLAIFNAGAPFTIKAIAVSPVGVCR